MGVRRAFSALLILFAAFVAATVPVAAQRPNGAGLVVRFDDGAVVYAYVQFEEESISSEDLLIRSGLSIVVAPFAGLGSGICKIQDTGCPSDDCFCASYSQPAFFWHFYSQSESGWAEQLSGASAQSVSDGDVDGWSWTAGDSGLPFTTVEEIALLNGVDLSEPTPTATSTATATATTPPPATATATVLATSTLVPQTSTPTPVDVPATATASPTATQPTVAMSNTPTDDTESSAIVSTVEPSPTTRAATPSATSARTTASPTTQRSNASTATLVATLTATLGPTTVAVLVLPDGTPVALVPEETAGGSASDYAMFGVLAALVVLGGTAVVYRNRKSV